MPELGWIAVDGDGLALADPRRVQEAAMLAALCETAEEAALVPDAAEIAEAAERALALCGDDRPELRGALEATREAALAAAAYGDGLRVARTGYVDQLADAARGARRRAPRRCSSARRGALGGPQRRGRSIRPSRSRARSGTCSSRSRTRARPERFSDALGDAAPAISAFAEDVLAHYRAELDDEEDEA